MKYISLLRALLYFGLILLVFLLSISSNSVKELSLGGRKTIRAAQARILLDDLELQIKYTINENFKKPLLNYREIEKIDDQLLRYEQQLDGKKLTKLKTVKQKWEQLKNRQTRDPSEMFLALDILHSEINKNWLEEIIRLDAKAQKDITNLTPKKIAIGFLIFIMMTMAMILDYLQNKQRNIQIKQLKEPDDKVTKPSSSFYETL